VAAAALRVHLADLPLERDEGDYAYVAQLLLGGVPPYTEAYEMRMPGIFAVYAVILAVFGESDVGIRLGLAVANAATALLLFGLARRLLDDVAGAGAAVAWLALSLGPGVLGVVANTEQFVIPAALAGLLLVESARGRATLALGGVCLGLALLTKQTAAPLVLFGALRAWRREAAGARRGALLALLGGALLPLVGAAALLAAAGAFGRFWFWTVLYPIRYVADVPLADAGTALLARLPAAVGASAPLWAVAVLGAAAALRSPRLRPAVGFALGFTAFAFAGVSAGLRFRPQHFLLLLPGIALLVGVAASALGRRVADAGTPRRGAVAAVLVVLLPVVSFAVTKREFLFSMEPERASRLLHGPNPFPEAVEIARYIGERSGPDDRIAVLGSEPQIYFYSGRRSATPYILMYELVRDHAFASAMRREMIEGLERAAPEFLVFVNVGTSWRPAPGSEDSILAWYREATARHYERVGQVNMLSAERTDYHWDEAARSTRPAGRGWISIWRRRDAAPQKGSL
jgi:hypothetical protein